MGRIIKVGSGWTHEGLENLQEVLYRNGYENDIIVADSELEVFEYDDLDNVTIHFDDVAEELGVEDTDEIKFLDNNSLNDGME